MQERSGQNEPYEPAPYEQSPYAYQPPAPAPATNRPRWKTPLIAGIALVVGIAIGAAAGGSKTNSTTTGSTGTTGTVPTTSATTSTASSPATVAAAPAKTVVLTTSGSGIASTKQFTVGANWSLKYTFNCSSVFGGQGNFQVFEDYPSLNVLANALAKSGADTSYQHGDAGMHSLKVNSECSWTVTVTDGDGG